MNKILLSLIALLFIPVMASASIDSNLYFGMQHNSDVKQLQEFLISQEDLTGTATGNFYSLTLAGVKRYQTSQGINATGYVGILTRTAINAQLAKDLSDSNNEAIGETGTVPPPVEAPKTNTDLYNSIQAQIQLLQAQLAALQAQQATLDQLAKTQSDTKSAITQIQQNTTPPVVATPPTPTTQVKLPEEPNPISGTIYIRSDIGNNLNQEDYLDFYMDGAFLQHMKFVADDSHLVIDTTKLSNGEHTLSVKSFDKKGVETDASEVLNVQN